MKLEFLPSRAGVPAVYASSTWWLETIKYCGYSGHRPAFIAPADNGQPMLGGYGSNTQIAEAEAVAMADALDVWFNDLGPVYDQHRKAGEYDIASRRLFADWLRSAGDVRVIDGAPWRPERLAGVPLVELANVTGASVELTPTEYYATLKLAEEHGWKRAGASNDRHAADSLHRAEGYDAVGAVLTAEDVSGLVAALKAARPVLATGEPVNELPASVRQLARICELHDSRRRFGDGWLRLLIPEVVSHAVR